MIYVEPVRTRLREKEILRVDGYPTVTPDGERVNLLKILLSNDCIHNCYYCGNREGRKGDRVRFSPEELVRIFLNMKDRGLVKGLFLSSAVDRNPFQTMDDMLKVTELLRLKYHFRIYSSKNLS